MHMHESFLVNRNEASQQAQEGQTQAKDQASKQLDAIQKGTQLKIQPIAMKESISLKASHQLVNHILTHGNSW